MRAIHALRGIIRVPAVLAFFGACLLTLGTAATALADDVYRPLVLAYTTSGSDVSGEVEAVRERLEEADFQTLGEYPVSDDRHVIVVTHDDLLAVAGSQDRAAYIAPIRVAVTATNGEVQVSYNNLEYFRHAYRIDASVSDVSARLADVLGDEQHFGSEDGMTPRELQRYRYTFGMERFNAPYDLGSHGSRSAALEELDAGLGERRGGVSEIYRLDIPGTDATLIGVAIRADDGAEAEAADLHTLETIDVRELRHTAYVPQEILVEGGDIEALHMRFRAALHWPDLRMLGDHSFMQLRRVPGRLEDTLREVAGFEEPEDDGFDW
ncbi:hypothetical protein [Thioalkalivibrio thiocyanoxidans]|uniref:hypothetical protein n=1 Tax=Thioalkalivibrio thiocyanoxidans TaxID=152475 RepID=UPI00036EC531|nr:hypothetical protein [Thioalkalivibrio thiocyanoxidans]